jgi:hypothetical protein
VPEIQPDAQGHRQVLARKPLEFCGFYTASLALSVKRATQNQKYYPTFPFLTPKAVIPFDRYNF